MSGKQHVTIGTISAILLAILYVYTNQATFNFSLSVFISGSVIGSYIPDIDNHNSIATQFFNKIVIILITFITLFYIVNNYCLYIIIGLNLDVVHFNTTIDTLLRILNIRKTSLMIFIVILLLSKLSPHRIFTHKWFGTSLFCITTFIMGNIYFACGFTLGYIMHIIADRFFTPNGKYLNFLEFKLPLVNSKGKVKISW